MRDTCISQAHFILLGMIALVTMRVFYNVLTTQIQYSDVRLLFRIFLNP